MESHQKNAGGNARIAETMFRYFRFPKDFPNFVWLSQVQQGVAIKTAVDYWRSLKPHCMGARLLAAQRHLARRLLVSLDYGGNWKLLHHLARRFFQPVTVVAIPEGETLRLIAVNDTAEPGRDRGRGLRRHPRRRRHPPPRHRRRRASAPTPRRR